MRRIPGAGTYSVIFAALMLLSCGRGKKPDHTNDYVNLATVTLDWVGNARADPKLKADFEATVACMRQQSPDSVKTELLPNVIVIAEPTFTCYGVPDARACTGFLTGTIYINKDDLYTYVFTHEAVHWIAQVDNSQHYRAYFQCAYMVEAFYQ